MTVPHTLSIPVAVLLSISTAIGGAWVSAERTQAGLVVRMEANERTEAGLERKIDTLQTQLGGYVPTQEFTLALADMKRELDDIRSDVKEIRHAVGTR